jgi:hypothetical protein
VCSTDRRFKSGRPHFLLLLLLCNSTKFISYSTTRFRRPPDQDWKTSILKDTVGTIRERKCDLRRDDFKNCFEPYSLPFRWILHETILYFVPGKDGGIETDLTSNLYQRRRGV